VNRLTVPNRPIFGTASQGRPDVSLRPGVALLGCATERNWSPASLRAQLASGRSHEKGPSRAYPRWVQAKADAPQLYEVLIA